MYINNLILVCLILALSSCATLLPTSFGESETGKAYAALGVYNSTVNAALTVVADLDKQTQSDNTKALRMRILLALRSADDTVRPLVNLLRIDTVPEGTSKIFLSQATAIQEALK